MLFPQSFRFTKGFRLVLLLQIVQCLLFHPGAALFGIRNQLVSPDPVFINFPRRHNYTRIVTRYLPATELPESSLPEVIDNRARNTVFLRTINNVANLAPSGEANLLSLPVIDTGLQPPSLSNAAGDNRFYLQPSARPANSFIANQATSSSLTKDSQMSFGNIYINEMSCLSTADDLYFRVSMKSLKNVDLPIMENAASDSCQVRKNNDEYRIDLGKEEFWNCGVVDCSTEIDKLFCLNLRFPVIPGLKLRGDMRVSLRCKPQEKTASHTKKITVKTLDTTARMVPGIISGGSRNTFDTDVALFRKTYSSENVFDTKIEPGGTVVLGEEVLLRVVVKEGDGWRYSRISDVNVHFVEKQARKKIMNSLWILDSNGCLNPDVRDICSREQYKHSSLKTYLIFQAFMFENMRESDEMVLSVKVTGCLDGADCILNCPGGHSRRTRSSSSHNQTVNWQDDIAFKVIYPKVHSENAQSTYLIVLCILFSLTIIAVVTLLWVIKSCLLQKGPNKF
ncbi:uncharacterized protein [Prorops nasuta]|uniref:uncharacterized protein n=1 Tax=Prorops nasuta TaxID=863751 RepID=UPI0034CF1E66